MRQTFTKLLLLAGSTLAAPLAHAQGEQAPGVDHSYKPLTLRLNETGSKYVRFIMWHQMWATYTTNNPGTLDVNGKPQDAAFDIAIRRSRFLAYSQISPRFLILTHWGINNASFINGGSAGTLGNGGSAQGLGGKRPQLYIHDAWTEFAVKPNALHVGMGLHYWNGVSRLSSASTLNFMTLDAPIFNWYNIEGTDQFARQFGIYAKGQVGRLDYRVALNKPYVFGLAETAVPRTGNATNVFNERVSYSGYFNWMFKEQESNLLPYFVNTYLGQKEVFNIGAGFYHHRGATASRGTGEDSALRLYDQTCLGVDLFYDRPINKAKGTALSIYGVYYNYDFGPNYLRNLGILNQHANPVAAAESFSGAGNLQPTIGTGSIGYLQAGYKLPTMKNGTSFMPYVAATYKDFERLEDPSVQFDVGLNYLLNNHNAKVTLQYSQRPVYTQGAGGTLQNTDSRSEVILQTHIFL